MNRVRYNLLTCGASNPKTRKKADEFGYQSAHLSLAPHRTSGYQTCPHSTAGCRKACIGLFSGRAQVERARESRVRRTVMLFEDSERFRSKLFSDLARLIRLAAKDGRKPVCRLNASSDIAWESKKFWEAPREFEDVMFYDYTKSPKRMACFLTGNFPPNYHLTFSRSGTPGNMIDTLDVLRNGGNATVVFDQLPLPNRWHGYDVIDGDSHDFTFRYCSKIPSVVLGLVFEGRGDKRSNFVESI